MDTLVTWQILSREIAPDSTPAMLQLTETSGQQQQLGISLRVGNAMLRLAEDDLKRLCAALSHRHELSVRANSVLLDAARGVHLAASTPQIRRQKAITLPHPEVCTATIASM